MELFAAGVVVEKSCNDCRCGLKYEDGKVIVTFRF